MNNLRNGAHSHKAISHSVSPHRRFETLWTKKKIVSSILNFLTQFILRMD